MRNGVAAFQREIPPLQMPCLASWLPRDHAAAPSPPPPKDRRTPCACPWHPPAATPASRRSGLVGPVEDQQSGVRRQSQSPPCSSTRNTVAFARVQAGCLDSRARNRDNYNCLVT